MKALILAAGKGTRLKEITELIPKPMIEFRGKPILLHNIELCKRHNIDEILINTFHLSERIKSYFGNGSDYGVNIRYSNEVELLGTSGALNNFKNELEDDDFFVIYGDNFSNIDFQGLIEIKEKHNPMVVIALHYREDVSASGVAQLDKSGKILEFIEKPAIGQTDSHWVNAGIYLVSPEIFKHIPMGFSDFGTDIFPLLLEQKIDVFGYCYNSDVLAFDTPEMYYRNNK